MNHHVIIAGYGVAGRFVAEALCGHGIEFVVVELNAKTCSAQREIGVRVIHGSIADEQVMRAAGVETASVLALAIPDEQAAIAATAVAHRIRPEIHIIAATRYTSAGFRALQNGADEVVVAEQAVAQEFYRRIQKRLSQVGAE
jgi:CPA2 family monovalent cation:H+ antiporter-2